MPFTSVPYDTLKIRINKAIVTLLKEHDLDPSNVDESLKKLAVDRRIPATFLLKMIESLDKDNPKTDGGKSTKKKTLNAAAYYAMELVFDTYSLSSPEGGTFNKGSTLYKELKAALEISEKNTPNETDLLELYRDLKNHLLKRTYVDGNVTRGYIANRTLVVDKDVIENFIETLGSKLQSWESNAIKLTKVAEEKKQALPSSSGFLGIFGGSGKAAADNITPSQTNTATSSM